jgi:putative two-component system hydrogenase maturation factor HypX/HoxX
MRILVHASAFNSLTQRITVELAYRGHQTSVVLDLGGGPRGDAELREAIRRHRPELIVAPMLTSIVPENVWSRHTCLIVHPGPPGDRGPSSLDWALATGRRSWGGDRAAGGGGDGRRGHLTAPALFRCVRLRSG